MVNATATAAGGGDVTTSTMLDVNSIEEDNGIMEMASPYIYLAIRLILAGSAVWYSSGISS